MSVTAVYSPDNIQLFLNSQVWWKYDLVKGKKCPVCSYPIPSGSCKRIDYHSKIIKRIYAIGVYNKLHSKTSDVLSKSIYNLKLYRNKARPLGLSIVELIKNRDRELLTYDYIIPVPQHKSEYKIDKDDDVPYDQAVEVCKVISNELSIPMLDGVLIKTRPDEKSKSDTSKKDFIGLYKCTTDKLNDKSVILVDDVMSRGFTLDACAQEIKNNGANTVSCYVCGITKWK